MYKSLDDISISREKSAKVILVSHSSVAASIIFTIFLVKSSKPNTVQCSLLLAAAAWLSKESGNQEKKRHAAQHNFSFWPNKEKRKDDDKDEANKKAT